MMVVPVTFVAACAAADNIFVIATIPDNLQHDAEFTRLYYLNPDSEEVWHYTDWPNHQVVSVALRRQREGLKRAGCALTGEGEIQIANSSAEHYEKIPGAGLMGERALGEVTRIREIGATLFACGGFGQVYKRDETGWMPIDQGLVEQGRHALASSFVAGGAISDSFLRKMTRSLQSAPNFNDIDGSDETDVYVCGNGGNLFHYDGTVWTKAETGTEAILTSLHCVTSDEIFVVGQSGVVLSGNIRSGFHKMGEFFPGSYIWSVRKFQGRIYLGTSRGLHVLEGSKAILVSSQRLDDRVKIVSVDSMSDTALWIATDRHAFRFDGEVFKHYQHGDNVDY